MSRYLNSISEFYQKVLLESPAGEPALKYLKGRGFTDETIRNFGVGFSPRTAVSYVTKGYLTYTELDTLVEVEHLFNSAQGVCADRFANRVTFPVTDSLGRVHGFAARAMSAVPQKYLNSAESRLYKKSEALFGFSLAFDSMYDKDRAIICEGYTDAMAFHQVGFTEAVAIGGTYASKTQLSKVARYTDNVYLAFDADDAGAEVTNRTVDLANSMGLNVKTLPIPEGKDPAEHLLESSGRIEQACVMEE